MLSEQETRASPCMPFPSAADFRPSRRSSSHRPALVSINKTFALFLFSSLSTSTSLLHASDSSRPAKQRAISVTLLSLASSSSPFSFACLLLFFFCYICFPVSNWRLFPASGYAYLPAKGEKQHKNPRHTLAPPERKQEA